MSTYEIARYLNGLNFSNLSAEEESAEYAAHTFEQGGKQIHFRVAKITPTKVGQFVTFWKRLDGGPIQPFDQSDSFDALMVVTCEDFHSGYFMFPKSALIAQDIISVNHAGGKRAFRVYPPWVKTESKQAQKTQSWQLKYFFIRDFK